LQKCGLGFDPGRGWSLIEYPVWLPGWLLHGLDAAWLAILSVPIGLWTARPRDLAIASVIMALALLPMPGWVGLQHATIVELFAAGGGVLLGRWLRSLAVR
jgi:hypothetical protein